MKMNQMNRMNPEKFDNSFHAKIGDGMDINIPMPPTANGNVVMNGGPAMGNGGFINYGYNTYLDPFQTDLRQDDGQQQYIEDEIDEYDDYSGHEKEVYFFPMDDVYVAPCCPDVMYRLLPCLSGDDESPFWIVWHEQRLLGSR